MKYAASCLFYLFLSVSAYAQSSDYGRTERYEMNRLLLSVEDERIARIDMVTAHRVIMKACEGTTTTIEKRNWVMEYPREAHQEMLRALRTCTDYTAENGAVVTIAQLRIVVQTAFNRFVLVTERAKHHPFSFQAR